MPSREVWKRRCEEAEVRESKLRVCLEEAVVLVEDIKDGEYQPDSFTTQPWKEALKETKSWR